MDGWVKALANASRLFRLLHLFGSAAWAPDPHPVCLPRRIPGGGDELGANHANVLRICQLANGGDEHVSGVKVRQGPLSPDDQNGIPAGENVFSLDSLCFFADSSTVGKPPLQCFLTMAIAPTYAMQLSMTWWPKSGDCA